MRGRYQQGGRAAPAGMDPRQTDIRLMFLALLATVLLALSLANPVAALADSYTWTTRYRATASSSHSSPVPGRDGMSACPSSTRIGSTRIGAAWSRYSSRCAVGVTASRW